MGAAWGRPRPAHAHPDPDRGRQRHGQVDPVAAARRDRRSDGGPDHRPRSAYGVRPERFSAALPFTAAGYLVHLGRIHGLRTGEAADRARSWLTRLGAAGHARTPLPELSKGTGQKVAVAQALLAEPDLLILDEAWTGLDAAARDELDRAVAERVAAGATVVFVDHDPRRLAGSAAAVFRIEGNGLLAAAGTPAAAAGPRVRIEAEGPPGAALPAGLPGAPEHTPTADGGVRLTVAPAHSDALLRALLTAGPPWHIRSLAAPGPAESPGADRTPHRSPAHGAATGPHDRSTPEAP